MKTASVLLLGLILCSCTPRGTSAPPIDGPAFRTIYSRLLVTAITSHKSGLDSLASAKAADSVLAAFGKTPDEMRATLRWYNSDPRRWATFYDSVVVALDENLRSAGRQR